MSLSLQHLQPGKRYAFTGIVNQTGMGKQTGRPTRMLFDVVTGDIYEEHTWLPYDNDVNRMGYRKFGDTVSFTAEAYVYYGDKVSIRDIEHLKHTGRVDITKILEMCQVKDSRSRRKRYEEEACAACERVWIAKNAPRNFGFGKKGTELHFHTEECRDAYMQRVFA